LTQSGEVNKLLQDYQAPVAKPTLCGLKHRLGISKCSQTGHHCHRKIHQAGSATALLSIGQEMHVEAKIPGLDFQYKAANLAEIWIQELTLSKQACDYHTSQTFPSS
jgi:hypothetical protein